jgi:hypothetical protein
MNLAVVHRYLHLPQKRVVFGHLLVKGDQRRNADRLRPMHGGKPLFCKRSEFGVNYGLPALADEVDLTIGICK